MREPNEVGIQVECSRCDRTVIGFLKLEKTDEGGLNLVALGFLIPLNAHVFSMFRPGEVALCQDCLEAKAEKPSPKIVVPSEI